MCTASWILEGSGYELFFNRDEKLTRKPADPPKLDQRDGIRFLAPSDGDFGGTWIGTNEFGVSVCLLNGVHSAGIPAPANRRSRGLLVLDLIAARSVSELAARLEAGGFSLYAPFTMAALGPSEPAAVMEWNGSETSFRFQPERQFMLTSSSFDSGRVKEGRRKRYALLPTAATPEQLRAFHGSHEPEASAYSVCIHRTDAQTVSFSRIRVSATETNFFYTPAALCKKAPGVNLTLPRSPLCGDRAGMRLADQR